jgi:hypothetical protein
VLRRRLEEPGWPSNEGLNPAQFQLFIERIADNIEDEVNPGQEFWISYRDDEPYEKMYAVEVILTTQQRLRFEKQPLSGKSIRFVVGLRLG